MAVGFTVVILHRTRSRIIIFYNHIGRRKYEKDPTPLEVEMRLYEDDANTAIINESAREAKEQDVK